MNSGSERIRLLCASLKTELTAPFPQLLCEAAVLPGARPPPTQSLGLLGCVHRAPPAP